MRDCAAADIIQGDRAAGGAQPLGPGQHARGVGGEGTLSDLDKHLEVLSTSRDCVKDHLEVLRQGARLNVDADWTIGQLTDS